MADADNIPSVLRQRLLAVPNLWTVSFQNPEEPYTPVKGTPYIVESFAFGTDSDTGPGDGGLSSPRWRRYDGAYYLLLHYPPRQGVMDVVVMANAIRSTFLAGAMSLPSGARLIVTDTGVQGLRSEPSWLKLPVTISYTYTTAS